MTQKNRPDSARPEAVASDASDRNNITNALSRNVFQVCDGCLSVTGVMYRNRSPNDPGA
ncbi:MAG: hypothetical protein GY711_23965 [bacterium]|nr:hypothetical protein [bacterium]